METNDKSLDTPSPILKSYLIQKAPSTLFPIALYPEMYRNHIVCVSHVITLYPHQKIEEVLKKGECVLYIITYSTNLPEQTLLIMDYIDNKSIYQSKKLLSELISNVFWAGIKAIRGDYGKYTVESDSYEFLMRFALDEKDQDLLPLMQELCTHFGEDEIQIFLNGFMIYGAHIALQLPPIAIAPYN